MRKKIIFGLLILMYLFLISGCINDGLRLKTYQNKEDGFKIKYYSDWEKNDKYTGTSVIFLSPLDSPFDTFHENVNVIVQDLTNEPMTLEEFTELSLSQADIYFYNLNIIELKNVTLDGYPAHKIIYTAKQGFHDLKFMQIWTIKDDLAYIVTFTAEENKYPYYIDFIQEMIASFKFI